MLSCVEGTATLKRASILIAIILAPISFSLAVAAEPIAGTWVLQRQESNGQPANFEPMTLRITQSGDKFDFAFSVPVNNIHYVSMRYSVRLDGTAADVENGQGEKLGSVRVTKIGTLEYKVVVTGKNRPSAAGTLTVSADRKSLTSESEAAQAGRTLHLKQVFARP